MDPDTSTALEQLQKSIQTFEELALGAVHRDNLWRYSDAFMQSLRSILEDTDCSNEEKRKYFNTTLEQYAEAMRNLFDNIISQASLIKADTTQFDVIEEVEKFNPYHDQIGRFSQADMAASFTYQTKDPNKQHWADRAIAREKERDEAGLNGPPSKNPQRNPKEISGAARGEPMSREEANGGNANPNYEQGGGYRTNCQTCVVAYEARLRGYDVQAKPYAKGTDMEKLARNTNAAWVNPMSGKQVSQYSYSQHQDDGLPTTAKQCRKWLNENVQPGARYTFSHGWKGRGSSGHIISIDKDSSGHLRLYDPQSGKTMTGKDVDTYLSRVRYTRTIYGTKYKTAPNLLRVDNLQFNPRYINNILEASA